MCPALGRDQLELCGPPSLRALKPAYKPVAPPLAALPGLAVVAVVPVHLEPALVAGHWRYAKAACLLSRVTSRAPSSSSRKS